MDVGYDVIIYHPKRERIHLPGAPHREADDILIKDFEGKYNNIDCCYDSRTMTKEEVISVVKKLYKNDWYYWAESLVKLKKELEVLPESNEYFMASFGK